jgi:polar amino acid transport system permease protein/polar amino acid transport system substrate-binding protein
MSVLYEALIADGAWRVFAAGVGYTLFITALSLVIATVLGGFLCALSRSKSEVFRALSRLYILVVGGTPAPLLLGLFYFVVFAALGIGALITACVAFGLKAGATIAEIFKTALNGVDKGQVQAARTLGFSALGAFLYVTLPQAARLCRRVYQNTVIELLQWTSVAGTITITDLTRVVNNMQARTGMPFLALAVGILLYLLLAAIVNLIFRLAGGAGEMPAKKPDVTQGAYHDQD